jgi:hypothetical protein
MSDAYKAPAQGRVGDAKAQISGHEDAERVDRLSDELAAFIADPADADMDRLDGILSALKETSPLPEGDAFDAEQGLRRFHERLAAQEAEKRDPAAGKSFISSSIRRSQKRAAAKILLIAAVLVLVLATTVQGFHLRVFDLIAQWSAETFGFKREAAEHAEITKQPLGFRETREYDSLEALIDDFGIVGPLFPTWVPERFEKTSIVAKTTGEGVVFQSDYQNGTGHLHIRFREIMPDLHQTEKDNLSSETARLHGISYYFFQDEGIETVSWINGNLECQIFGTASREEMKQIVYSIYGGNKS